MRDSKRGTIEDPATDRLLALAFEQQKSERLLAESSYDPDLPYDAETQRIKRERDEHSKHVDLLDRQWIKGGPTLRELLADSGRGKLIEFLSDSELDGDGYVHSWRSHATQTEANACTHPNCASLPENDDVDDRY